MISPAMRSLLYLMTAGYGVVGAILFLAPHWASGNFAWNVSPFVAMTIGGWCIGTAFASFIVARRGSFAALICPITFLALFGLFETAVLAAFRERLLIANPLAWLYCATLAVTVVFALMAVLEAMRRPVLVRVGAPLGTAAITATAIFILLVGFLGIYGLTATPGMRGLNASIFPEVLSPFSLRAFGAFYLALAFAAIPLLLVRGMGNLVSHGFAVVCAARFHNRRGLRLHRPVRFCRAPNPARLYRHLSSGRRCCRVLSVAVRYRRGDAAGFQGRGGVRRPFDNLFGATIARHRGTTAPSAAASSPRASSAMCSNGMTSRCSACSRQSSRRQILSVFRSFGGFDQQLHGVRHRLSGAAARRNHLRPHRRPFRAPSGACALRRADGGADGVHGLAAHLSAGRTSSRPSC